MKKGRNITNNIRKINIIKGQIKLFEDDLIGIENKTHKTNIKNAIIRRQGALAYLSEYDNRFKDIKWSEIRRLFHFNRYLKNIEVEKKINEVYDRRYTL